jgi:hypothetical protein
VEGLLDLVVVVVVVVYRIHHPHPFSRRESRVERQQATEIEYDYKED